MERLYDLLDTLRWQWHMFHESGRDAEAERVRILIDMVNRRVLREYGELSLTVYYQWK